MGRHFFAWYSRDACDAGGSLVARKHERVWMGMTHRCSAAVQRLVDAVTRDQSTDRHLDTDIDVRVTSQPRFPEREAGAAAPASRAQETPRE